MSLYAATSKTATATTHGITNGGTKSPLERIPFTLAITCSLIVYLRQSDWGVLRYTPGRQRHEFIGSSGRADGMTREEAVPSRASLARQVPPQPMSPKPQRLARRR